MANPDTEKELKDLQAELVRLTTRLGGALQTSSYVEVEIVSAYILEVGTQIRFFAKLHNLNLTPEGKPE